MGIYYKLKKSNKNEIDKLIQYKLATIFAFAKDLPENEIEKIKKYVYKNVPLNLILYKSIYIDDELIGCLLVKLFRDGVIIDEIYLEEKARNKGIGTDIIKNVMSKNNIIYLCVYKNNIRAINLYETLGFKITDDVVDETKLRFYMKYDQKKQ